MLIIRKQLADLKAYLYNDIDKKIVTERKTHMIRIDKFLSQMQVATRSESKKLIKMKRITKNGALVTDGGEKCDPQKDCICLDGHPIAYQEYHYLMLHKPAGCVTATEDRRDKTVMDYLPDNLRRGVSPVGRLDKDTEGLLLITDDGALNHSLLAPGRHVPKTYYARIHGIVTEDDITAFKNGLDIGEKKLTAPAALKILHIAENEQTSEILVTITEGKFHQVKRMFQSVGKKVSYLKRLSMGSLHLDEKLTPGAWRELTLEEITKLKEETI